MSHTLVEQKSEDGTNSNYYCMQCGVEFASVVDFMESHQNMEADHVEDNIEDCIEVSQWEALDDLIEYEVPAEDNDAIETQNNEEFKDVDTFNLIQEHHDGESGVIKVEDDVGDNKYYCYDCRTVFSDLCLAEEHDCPGIGNALEEEDSKKNVIQNVSVPIDDELVDYMCAYCEQKFGELSDLEQHQVSCDRSKMEKSLHEESTQFQCSICSKSFANVKALNSHNRTHKTKSLEDIELIQQNQSSESRSCPICNTQFTNLRSLKLHLRIHKDRPVRRIQEALPKAAAQKYNRLDHFFCEICNKSFDQNLLAVHKNMHQNIEEYICRICNRQFKDKESYEVHQQLHSSDINTENPIINTGPTNAALRNAKKGVKSMHVANAKKTFPCQYCGHLFWRPHEKVRHEYVHTGEKPYPCEVCGKRFRVPYSLTLHLRTHTDIRPYVCASCNKRFKSHSVYTHHLNTHLNDRAYQCDICGKSFRTTVQLYGHKNNHTKPFNCTLCNRPFASLFAVNAHMKSHAKSKTFENFVHSCDICGAVYAALRALRAHKKEMHDIESTKIVNQSDLDCQTPEETRSEDEHYEADAAAMMLLTAESEANNKQVQNLSNFDNNESLDNLSVDHYYLN